MAKSQQLLNQLRWCFKSHGSIYPIESVKLPSVNYYWQIQDRDIQDGVPLLYRVQAPLYDFVPVVIFDQPLYSKATEIILDPPPCSLL